MVRAYLVGLAAVASLVVACGGEEEGAVEQAAAWCCEFRHSTDECWEGARLEEVCFDHGCVEVREWTCAFEWETTCGAEQAFVCYRPRDARVACTDSDNPYCRQFCIWDGPAGEACRPARMVRYDADAMTAVSEDVCLPPESDCVEPIE